MSSSNQGSLSSEDGSDKKLRSVLSDVDKTRRRQHADLSTSDESNNESARVVHEHALVQHNSGNHGNNNVSMNIANDDADSPQQGVPQRNTEQRPLMRAPRRRKEDRIFGDERHVPNHVPRRYGTIPRSRPSPPPRRWYRRLVEQACSFLLLRSTSVMVFMLLLVLCIVLTTAANVKLDGKSVQIEPADVLVYITLLMIVFILWVTYCLFVQNRETPVPQMQASLIPTHLLTGIAIFGTAASMAEILRFVAYIKCNRHVNNLNHVYAIYPFVKSFFVYFQIYFFYKLSRNRIRDSKVPAGNFFLMLTLATNMCIWWATFLNDASNDARLADVTWLSHYYFGIKDKDVCANASITSVQVKQLHNMLYNLQPYIVACSLEYVLLASAILLHVWQALKDTDASKVQVTAHQYWTLWRGGFIVGLLSIPSVVVAYIHQEQVKVTTKVILCCLQGIICTVLIISSLYCIKRLQSSFVKVRTNMKLDVIILGVSYIGFPFIDLAGCFASVAEFGHMPTSQVVWFGLACVADLAAAGLQLLLIKTAYAHQYPDIVIRRTQQTAQRIRQFASFALVVNIAYWGAKTKELRRSGNPVVTEMYFGKYTYFALTHVAYPLCIFFHFHSAICFSNIISFYSQFRLNTR